MKFAVLETKTKGLPEIYSGMVYMDAEKVTGTFTFNQKVMPSVKRKPDYLVDSEGNKTQKTSQKGNPIEERAVFLPLIYNGQEILVASKSPLLVRLLQNIEVGETQDWRGESKLDILSETLEGTFRFCKEPYEYTKQKTANVFYLQEVE